MNGNVVSTIELDPWGANTTRSTNSAFLPQNFTSYIRDANGGQDAMARRYSAGGRFAQPDPYGGSYDFTDPQSLNRYAYTKNDPVNFRDPSGLGIISILRTIGRWLNRESSGSGGGPGPILSGDNGFVLEEGGDEGGDVGTGPQNLANREFSNRVTLRRAMGVVSKLFSTRPECRSLFDKNRDPMALLVQLASG